ncbi:DUF2789 family protein [Cellvibrio sp. pealriver]|uniref:DUF2789 family protein n=1 Tax=Cellvibrio sp. pealriver TaxID=1622269 RepID=UPI0009E3F106|nr:DUF2789 family protein [Cellvibrio sp. pealriver]
MLTTNSSVDMHQLFSQLGLESSNLAIARFIKHHHLPEGIALEKADFWTPAQRQLIHQSLKEDAEWSQAVDQLAALLRH